MLATALVFVAALIPNLIISPIAGTLVDRWDHKEVLIVSDLLRAATVLLIPVAIVINVILVYPFVFLLTTISIFFRPARVAILPRTSCAEDELVTANSALWVGETAADIIGYPLAGLFVVALGAALPVAFWLDAVTYLASAALLSTIDHPHACRSERRATDDEGEEPEVETGAGEGFVAELKAGYRFLRTEATLFANTIQAHGRADVGRRADRADGGLRLRGLRRQRLRRDAVYAFLETSVGIGNLVGGFVIGLVGARVAKGRMISRRLRRDRARS